MFRAVFAKVLVANRGEIAIRVMRALEELGVATVGVYSELDRDAPHARRADDSYLLGPGPPSQSYLVIDKLLEAARRSGAEAVHPGYGFLAENAAFARACAEAGLVFIGPPPQAIEAMGSKTRARALMRQAGIPIVPGTTDPIATVEDARAAVERIGYPVAIKAAGGGGGRGFRVATSEKELAPAFDGAASEGERFFSDASVYVERYLSDPRHVEVQLLADAHGHVIHLGERDCSVQRRHQKLIEESPAPSVGDVLRERIGRIAVEAARAVGYRSAGTVEGLLVGEDYLFLEMNTRVQVEHCVTELTSGIDIVKEQVRIAAGEPLSVSQGDVALRGHAIECRVNAEDASKGFVPAPGRITAFSPPAGPGIRVDSGVEAGSEISPVYDSLVAKVNAWGADRDEATRRMRRALAEFELEGVRTLIPFHSALLRTEQWTRGETCRDLIEDPDWLKRLAFPKEDPPARGQRAGQAKEERTYAVEVSGRRFDVKVIGALGPDGAEPAQADPGSRQAPRRRERARRPSSDSEQLLSPLRGTIARVAVAEGVRVEEGALICVIEAMKMENEITAHRAGTVEELAVAPGGPIASGDRIAVIR
jgi:acetyl-CoA/propionyl-CoA carboxylase biotin carboxyl carrier protein